MSICYVYSVQTEHLHPNSIKYFDTICDSQFSDVLRLKLSEK